MLTVDEFTVAHLIYLRGINSSLLTIALVLLAWFTTDTLNNTLYWLREFRVAQKVKALAERYKMAERYKK